MPCEPTVGCSGTKRPAFAGIGLRCGQEEHAVARAVHNIVRACHHTLLAEER